MVQMKKALCILHKSMQGQDKTANWKSVELHERLERILHYRVVRHWNKLAKRSTGHPIPGSVQGQVGQGFEQPHCVEGIFKAPSNPNHSTIPQYSEGFEMTISSMEHKEHNLSIVTDTVWQTGLVREVTASFVWTYETTQSFG